jgi:hypothetical protein
MSEGIGYSYHSAFFVNFEDAQSAFDDVISLGIHEEHISLTQGSPESAPRNPRKELNFIDFKFSGIFSYNNKAKGPQGHILSLDAPEDLKESVLKILSLKGLMVEN